MHGMFCASDCMASSLFDNFPIGGLSRFTVLAVAVLPLNEFKKVLTILTINQLNIICVGEFNCIMYVCRALGMLLSLLETQLNSPVKMHKRNKLK